MNRAERRRAKKDEYKTKVATHNLTKEQIDNAIERGIGERLEEIRKNATYNAIDASMNLTLVLPMKVLMEKYWANDLDLLQMFADDLFEVYEKWMNEEIDLEAEKQKVWDIAGVKIEEVVE